MKKIFIAVLAVVVSFAFTSAAVAAKKVKVPKAMCFSVQNVNTNTYASLAIGTSKGGKVKLADKVKVDFVPFQGMLMFTTDNGTPSSPISPITGTGFVEDGDLSINFASMSSVDDKGLILYGIIGTGVIELTGDKKIVPDGKVDFAGAIVGEGIEYGVGSYDLYGVDCAELSFDVPSDPDPVSPDFN